MTDKMLAPNNNSETDGQLREDLATEPVVLLFHRLASSAKRPSGDDWKELFAMMGRRTAPVIRLLHDRSDSNMRSRLMWKLFRAGGGARDFNAKICAL